MDYEKIFKEVVDGSTVELTQYGDVRRQEVSDFLKLKRAQLLTTAINTQGREVNIVIQKITQKVTSETQIWEWINPENGDHAIIVVNYNLNHDKVMKAEIQMTLLSA